MLVCPYGNKKIHAKSTTKYDSSFQETYFWRAPGAKATGRLVTNRFFWLGAQKDCRQWVSECTDCHKNKVHRHTQSPTSTFPVSSQRFSHVHMDNVGPLRPPRLNITRSFFCVKNNSNFKELVNFMYKCMLYNLFISF